MLTNSDGYVSHAGLLVPPDAVPLLCPARPPAAAAAGEAEPAKVQPAHQTEADIDLALDGQDGPSDDADRDGDQGEDGAPDGHHDQADADPIAHDDQGDEADRDGDQGDDGAWDDDPGGYDDGTTYDPADDVPADQHQIHRTRPAVIRRGLFGRKRRSTPDVDPDDLAAGLAVERELTDVEREDLLVRRERDVRHRIAMADLEASAAAALRARETHEREERDAAEIRALYSRAATAGAAARLKSEMYGSAEMRALRVAALQRWVLIVGLSVLGGFGAWSTAGAQKGLTVLLGLDTASALWWAAWLVEPCLIAIVAGMILMRAILSSSGGTTDWRATLAEWVALTLSIGLNLTGGGAASGEGTGAIVGHYLSHSVGALGAAGTAWLIGVGIEYTTAARPFAGAPRLASLNIVPPAPPAAPVSPPVAPPVPITSNVHKISTAPTRKIPSAANPNTRTQPERNPNGTRTNAPERPRSAGANGSTSGVAPVPAPGPKHRDSAKTRSAARAYWTTRRNVGEDVSGAELGRRYGQGERWGQFQRKAAQAAWDAAHTTPPAATA